MIILHVLVGMAISIAVAQVTVSQTWRFETHEQTNFIRTELEEYWDEIRQAEIDFRHDPPLVRAEAEEVLSYNVWVNHSTRHVMVEIFFSASDISAVYLFDENKCLLRRYLRSSWDN